MKRIEKKVPEVDKDKRLATLLWIAMVLTMVFIVFSLVVLGVGGIEARLPPANWTDVLLANAFFLFVIGATDYPDKIRRSTVLRTQICCWSALMLAVAFLIMPALRSVLQEGIGYFASALLMIALYSSGVIYRSLRKREG